MTRAMIIRPLGVLASLLCTVSLLLGCGANRSMDGAASGGGAATTVIGTSPASTSGAASYITARSLDELVAKSSIIVIGHVTGTDKTLNLARNPADPAQPDQQYYSVGQTYSVAVQRYLKGDGAAVVQLVQQEGFLVNPPAALTPRDIDRARAGVSFIPLQVGPTYLLFLRPLGGFPADAGYLTGTAQPARFTLPAGGTARAESPWGGAEQVFPPRSSATLIEQVERLVAPSR